jgi:hypothetical protein
MIYMYMHTYFCKCYFSSSYYREWQRSTEENAGLRGTIEGYKEEIADMSKQLE